MKVSDFIYDLPRELIASYPLRERDSARLMLVERISGKITHTDFREIGKHIASGDGLVLNDTKVIPARLFGRRKTGGQVEIFLVDPFSEPPSALVRPSKKIAYGEEIQLEDGSFVKVLERAPVGRHVKFNVPVEDVLRSGHVPLPPYISRSDIPEDREDYQTVYASIPGATAAPTAGLHFTLKLLEDLSGSGVKIARVTLHTSYGTFSPVKTERVEEHEMHAERYEIKDKESCIINEVKSSGHRLFAVGTTSTRVLETCALSTARVNPSRGESKLFIYPGYRFKIVDGMVTNFHLPGSTLIMMVAAFLGKELAKEAYRKAIEEKYRFFSYGDAMLIM